MDNEMISVIVSVYNTPACMLKEAVESIWMQTYKAIEFILVNDHSTKRETLDAIKNIVEEYPQIVLINNESNYGLTKSLNIALGYCSGKYIARMDADDISCADRFMKQRNYMESHPEVCIVGSQVEKFGGLSTKQPLRYRDYTGDEKRFRIKMLFENAGPVHPTVMIRRDFLVRNGITYREEIKKTQDYALWIDCLNAGGKIKNLDIPLLKYRIHEGQISEKDSEEQKRYRKQIIEEQIVQTFGLFSEERLRVFSMLYSENFGMKKRIYIEALKEIMERNKLKSVYEEDVFNDEIRQRWIHKCIKCLMKGRDISGFFTGYTWRCLFSKSFIRWIKERIS